MILDPASPSDEAAPIAEKDTIVPIGIHGIQEKGFTFEMLVSLMLSEGTHHAIPTKVPEPLLPLFPGKKMLTKLDGERIRVWNEGGVTLDPHEQLRKRAHAAAESGMEAYKEFFAGLAAAQRKAIPHEELKAIAAVADQSSPAQDVGEGDST